MWDLQRFWQKFTGHLTDPRRGILFCCALVTIGLGSLHFYHIQAAPDWPARSLNQLSPLSPLTDPPALLTNAPVTTTLAPNLQTAAGSQTSLTLIALVLIGILLTISLVRWRQR